jgi:endonuclease-3
VSAGKVDAVTRRLAKQYGRPRARASGDPLDLLVSAILSQNTTDKNSDQAYRGLRRVYPSWKRLALARPRAVEKVIKSAGLGRLKAKRLIDVLRRIEKERGRASLRFLHEMATPEALEYLTSFKGIGLKTACVVLAFACRRDIFPVDTHVARVSGRLGLVPGGTSADRVHHLLEEAIAPGEKVSLHLNLVRFGREVCQALRPRCGQCFMKDLCERRMDTLAGTTAGEARSTAVDPGDRDF